MQAIQCAAAADAYAKANQCHDWFVHYLLMGTGVECALKAYGILHGARDLEHLRKWGYDLEKALAFAERHGLQVPEIPRGSVKLLSALHKSKATTYPRVKGRMIPRPQIVRGLLDELIREVFVGIWGPEQYEHDCARTLGMTIAAGHIC